MQNFRKNYKKIYGKKLKNNRIERFKITHTPPGVRRNVDYTKATEEKNLAKLKAVNEFLVENGQEEYKLITVDEVKESLTEEEKRNLYIYHECKGKINCDTY